MQCPFCQSTVEAGLAYCSQCGKRLTGGQGEWTFGRDPACDIVVDQAEVSWRHGRLIESGGLFLVEDTGSTNGIYVQGQRVFAPMAVTRGEAIRLGSQALLPWPGLSIRRVIRIGSHPQNDVVLDVVGVSPWHAQITFEGDQPVLEDMGSAQGTALNTVTNRILRAPLSVADAVYFGSYRVAASQLLREKKLARGGTQIRPIRASGAGGVAPPPSPGPSGKWIAGQDPQCRFPIDHPSVAWHHAEIRQRGVAFEIRDLGTLHGTFVQGERTSGWRKIQMGDEVAIGTVSLSVNAAGELIATDYGHGFRVDLIQAETSYLAPVSLSILPAELVAIMGPSGAGKTTLLQLVNGALTPKNGRVMMNGRDFRLHRDQFRIQIGYVPQDDILHAQLTVLETLRFTARLRTDLSLKQIEERAAEVLADLQLTHVQDKPIGSVENKTLSGGERKRVNLAQELLGRPPLLLMDEPTSGLSSEDAEVVVRLVQRLSQSGSTVIMTIHQPSLEIFKLFDALVVIGRDRPAPGGCVYFGPAYQESLRFFNPTGVAQCESNKTEPRPELLFKGMEGRSAAEWNQAWQGSPYFSKYVTGRQQDAAGGKGKVARAKRSFLRQILPLSQRNFLTKIRDRGQMLTFALQAPVVGLLIALAAGNLAEPLDAFKEFKEWRQYVGRIASTHFMLAVAAIWFGCNNAAREIVGEWAIYKRERMVNLSIPAYVASKFSLLALVAALQAAILMAITSTAGLQAPVVRAWLTLMLLSLVGSAAGLCISAARKTTEAAIAILPIVLLPVILFGGGLRPLHESGDKVKAAARIMPTRWAFEANLVEEACARQGKSFAVPDASACPLADTHFPEKPPSDSRTPWSQAVLTMGGQLTLLLVASGLILRWRDGDDQRKGS